MTAATETYAHLSLTGAGDNRIDSQWPGLSLACQACMVGGSASPNARFLYDNVPFVGGDPFASGSATVKGVTSPVLVFLWGTDGPAATGLLLPEIAGSG